MNLIPVEYQAYFVILIVFLLFFAIYRELLKPAVAFLTGIIVLVISGIIQPAQVLEGLSNQSIAIVVLLILITAGIRTHYNIETWLEKIFKARTYKAFLTLMMTKVALLSSVVNNTPVVVLMTPFIFNWGKKNNISPSKLLIPLSYATIIGGMLTLIGTSTTLVLNGFLIESNLEGIDTYSLFITGSVVLVICLLYLVLFSNKLLPDRPDLIEEFSSNKREYLIEKRLKSDSDLVGKSVVGGHLRNLKGVYLVEIIRKNTVISPVDPLEIIQADDVLIFAGNTDDIIDLTISDLGVELPENLINNAESKVKVVESVISANSSLIGRTIRESNFRKRYDAAVVAIHRNGEKLSGKIGNITIKAGDVLLMYAGNDFENRVDLYKDLYIISGVDKEIKMTKNSPFKLITLGIIALALIVSQVFNLFVSLLIICSVMVLMKLITIKNIKRDLDVNLIVILVLSLALGEAMISSGAGTLMADFVLSALEGQSPVVILAALMIITTILTSFVTNIGAVAISFPLALALSNEMDINGAPFFLALAFSSSAAFLTPIGYQTNLIIYGPGGYNFKDFLKIGFPITIIYLSVVLFMISYLYHDLLF